MCSLISFFVLSFILFVDSFLCNAKIKDNESVTNLMKNLVEGKIVGGKSVTMEQFPSSVQFFNCGSLCAGTIINSWSVLTAAHCFDHSKDIYDMALQVGSRYTFDYDADIYDVMHFMIHKDYNKTIPFSCDIALIYVDKHLQFGEKAKKALIVNSSNWMSEKEKEFIATGWGWTKYGGPISELGLMMTKLKYVSRNRCSQLHKTDITPDMFCLYGEGSRDTCKGDSGGGVLWNGMVVGIVSHGDGCAEKNKPSVYTNVWHFRKWIEESLNNFFDGFCYETIQVKLLNNTKPYKCSKKRK